MLGGNVKRLWSGYRNDAHSGTMSRRDWLRAEDRANLDLGPLLSQWPLSPAGLVAPPSAKPGWNWTPPEASLQARLDLAPRRIRLLYRLPLVDRYACIWMWHHACWEVHPFVWPEQDGVGRIGQPPRPSPLAASAEANERTP